MTLGIPRSINTARKFNRQQLKDACRILGCKAADTSKLASKMFRNISDIVRSTIEVRDNVGSYVIPAITITRRLFEKTAHGVLEMLDYKGYF